MLLYRACVNKHRKSHHTQTARPETTIMYVGYKIFFGAGVEPAILSAAVYCLTGRAVMPSVAVGQ